MTDWVSQDVICPYYKTSSGSRIVCEAFIKGADKCTSDFPNRVERANHMETYCNTYDYSKCPVAALCEKKYR